jgi:lycopene cyclase domain-containing protein
MTYAEFLLIFLILPLCVLFGLSVWMKKRGCLSKINVRRHWVGVALLALIAFVWTTPWDNYLISRGVWDSPEERILGRWGYVPIEEYAFFVLMPLLNGVTLLILLRLGVGVDGSCYLPRHRLRMGAMFVTALVMAGGFIALMFPRGTYLGMIVVWFTPPLLIQWCYDPCALVQEKRVVILGTLIPTFYFGLADRFAIENGIWKISDGTITGLYLLNVPIEELLFFATTSLLLAQGLVLWHNLRNPVSAT